MRHDTKPQEPAIVELRAAFARARAIAIDCGLAYTEVDAILDLAPGTFRSMCAMMPAGHPAEARMRVLADTLDYAARLLGDRMNVATWLRAPNRAMDGRSPMDLLRGSPMSLRAMRDALRGEWERSCRFGFDDGGRR